MVAPEYRWPLPGPQEKFMRSQADIAIYGGGAGGGKTFCLLMEPLRHVNNPRFGAVFFRRTSPQIRNEGGLWDESLEMYLPVKGKPTETTLDWEFPSGAAVSFRHMQHDKDRFDWQGSQIPLQCWDELTHFSEDQFWYLMSRSRSTCGVRPYVRATCNPDPDSWVAEFISWWIDQDTGYPIPERAGALRWFVRMGNLLHWADTPEELAEHTYTDENGEDVPIPPKSVTFVPSLVTDNKVLLQKDPGYMATLLALDTVNRERLLRGNWKVRPAAGMFQTGWVKYIDQPPTDVHWVRAWDLAATSAKENANAAWTVGLLVGRDPRGNFYLDDCKRIQGTPHEVEQLMQATAEGDRIRFKRNIYISFPQDPGQAGKAQAQSLVKNTLVGYDAHYSVESGDKVNRASPVAAQFEAGNVYLVAGAWCKAYVDELVAFPEGQFKDQVDATSRGFMELTENKRAKTPTVTRVRL